MRTTLKNEYEKRGIPFNPESITTKEDMENHFRTLQAMKDKEEKLERLEQQTPKGTPLSWQQFQGSGNYGSKNQDVPIDLRKYENEAEMILDLENEAKSGSEFSEEAKKTLSQLTRKAIDHDVKHGSEYEFQGEITKWKDPKERIKWRKRS